jgi:PAS domain S-box-containing protein
MGRAEQPVDRETPGRVDDARRVVGRGEMAELTRQYHWENSSLGPISNWPQALLTTVNMMLSCPQPMFLWWGPKLIQFYNDGYRLSIRGDKHPKALGQAGRECWQEIWDVIGPQIDAVMSNGEPTFHRNQLVPILRNGQLEDVYWTYSYSPVYKPDGTIAGTLVVCTETTEEIMALERLRKSENRFRRLIEEANIGVAIVNAQEELTYLNPSILNLLGYSGEDFASGRLDWKNLIPGEFRSRDRQAAEQLERYGKAAPYETAYRAKDGGKVPLLVDAMQIADLEGGAPEAALFLADLSALKRAELALLQNEKLAAVGRLASSIAHEINNPLEALTNLLYLIENDAETHVPAEETLTHVRTAQAELARVANITRHTLRFHRQLTKPVLATKAEILEEVLVLFRGRLSALGLKIKTKFSPVPPTLGYSGDLRQLFANFIGNAADASQKGGTILLREREGTDWKTGRKGVRITVADRGHGMSRATAQHIFEPFFTTKDATGTGLGLWVSAGILSKHGARITLRSSQDRQRHGTVFSMWFALDPNLGASDGGLGGQPEA